MGATFWKNIYTKLLTSGGIEFQDGRIKTQGSGSPEGVVTASVGSEYTDTSTGVLYLKQSGSGNTGWGANVNPALKDIIDYSHRRGEIFPLDDLIAENQSFNPLDPESYFPAICLSSIDVQEVLNTSSYPSAFIDNRRAVKLRYLVGESGEVSSWSVTVSGSNITFPNTASANAMLAGLYEDYNVHGATFTNHRTVDVAGATFAITNINLVTRVVTVSGSPTTGSQTAEFYPYRIAGSTTSIRVFAVKGAGLMAPNDPDGYFIMNLRTRGYFQGHWHTLNYSTGPADGAVGAQYYSRSSGGSITAVANSTSNLTSSQVVSSPITDGTNGTPLVRKITHGPGLTQIFYMWFGG